MAQKVEFASPEWLDALKAAIQRYILQLERERRTKLA